jgi:hypothetical protein
MGRFIVQPRILRLLGYVFRAVRSESYLLRSCVPLTAALVTLVLRNYGNAWEYKYVMSRRTCDTVLAFNFSEFETTEIELQCVT